MNGRAAGERGVALLMVIWVLTALAIILSEFVFSVRTSVNAARNARVETEGYYLAMGAIRQALADIDRPYRYLRPGEDGGVIFVRQERDAEAPVDDTSQSGTAPGGGKYTYRIRDEEGKMNLNTADRKQLAEFLREIGMDIGVDRDTVIDSILDWRDADDLHRLNGAEDDYYTTLTPPYRAKNGPFTTVQELLLVKGVTPELFYGGGEGNRRPLADQITVYGEGHNNDTASREVLVAWYGVTQAEKIIAERQNAPKKDRSYYFTVDAEGLAAGAATPRKIRAVVRRGEGSGARRTETSVVQWWDYYLPPEEAPREE